MPQSNSSAHISLFFLDTCIHQLLLRKKSSSRLIAYDDFSWFLGLLGSASVLCQHYWHWVVQGGFIHLPSGWQTGWYGRGPSQDSLCLVPRISPPPYSCQCFSPWWSRVPNRSNIKSLLNLCFCHFANFSLTKANHIGKLKLKRQGNNSTS